MNFKAFIFLGLLFSLTLLVSSALAAETSKDEKKSDSSQQMNQVDDAKYDCYHGCCIRGYYGCQRCCSYAGEYEKLNAAKKENQVDDAKYYGGGYGHGGGHGGGHCCGGGRKVGGETKP